MLSREPEKERGPRLGTRAPKDAFRSRLFFHRGVGSSILASLSEAGGNDLHQPANKPLPPRSPNSVDRLSECPRFPPAQSPPVLRKTSAPPSGYASTL